MRAFKACYIGEFKKLRLKKKYVGLTVVSAAICAFLALVSSFLGRFVTDGLFLESIAITVMPVFTQLVMPLVAMMAACDLFAAEFRDLSIKAQLMRPVTRFKIYIAKLCAIFSVCATVFLSVFAAAAICDGVFAGSLAGVAYAFGAYLINLIALMPVILMAALINQFTKGSTSAMFLCIIVYILMKLIGVFVPVFDSLMFTGYLSWHKLWLGNMLPIGALFSKCILLLGYGITFFSGGYYLFLKREF